MNAIRIDAFITRVTKKLILLVITVNSYVTVKVEAFAFKLFTFSKASIGHSFKFMKNTNL